jgi:hypothetical protein
MTLCAAAALLVVSVMVSRPSRAQEATGRTPAAPTADVGEFYPLLKAHADSLPRSLSYLSRDWPDREQWRNQGRAKMQELLVYDPPAGPKDAQVLEKVQKEGYTRSLVRFSVTADRTTDAFLLIPDNLKGPAPAVVAIHDHGGFYYFGKEKITRIEDPPNILRQFIERSYGGRTYADELARRVLRLTLSDRRRLEVIERDGSE